MAQTKHLELIRSAWHALWSHARTKTGTRPWLIGAVGTLIALVVMAAVAATLLEERYDRLERSRERADNLAAIIANTVRMQADVYDTLLHHMVEEAENPMTPLFPERVHQEFLFGKLLVGAREDEAYIVDEEGKIGASSATWESTVRLNDRDYFVAHERKDNIGLYISAPFLSRVKKGQVSIGVARRIEHPDQSFAGVALLVIQIDIFHRVVDQIAPHLHGSVYIVREGGDLFACQPCGDLSPGFSLAPTAVQSAVQMGGITHLDLFNPEILTVQRVPDTPLFVAIEPPLDGVLSRWRSDALLIGSLALMFSIGITVGSWSLARAWSARAKAQEELMALSLTDGLTGLSNRRAFDTQLADEWQRARRSGTELSLLFIDIDHFKHYNDRYGHAVGDEVLRKVARCIGAHVRRSSDMAARYGGEEFAVILPTTPVAGAVALAERIRTSTRNLNVVNSGSQTGLVTISIGCATATPHVGGSPEALLEAADAQLLVAKASGRDQVKSVVLDGIHVPLSPEDAAEAARTESVDTAPEQSPI